MSALSVFANASAATYYVDFAAGSDAAVGTSRSTAWKHCPGDPQATGNSATTLIAGDTVIFKGGVEYLLQSPDNLGILLKSSGVTYDGNSDGEWGTGRAVVTDHNANPGHIAFYGTNTRSNLVFRSLTIKRLGGATVLPIDKGTPVPANNGWGIIFSSGTAANGITIQDCDFSELGYWFNQKPMDSASIDGAGIRFYDGKNILVTNCNFSKVSLAAGIYASAMQSNITFTACTFSDSIRWGIDIAVCSANASMDYLSVRGCTFFDYDQFDQRQWAGYGGWPHTDGIFHRADYSGGTWGSHIDFCNNFFYQTREGGGGTASIYITEGPSANIFNNVFYYQGKTRAISLAGGPMASGSPQILRIYNNTFVDNYTAQIDWGKSVSPVASGAGSLLSVLNNIFVDTETKSANNFMLYAADSGSAALTNMIFDYNLYYTGNQLGNFAFWNGVYGESKLAGLRSVGWELHGKVADPKFINLELDRAKVLSGNLHLKNDSPAISTGTNLLKWFNVDRSGVPRANNAWDLGAWQHSGIYSPQNLKLVKTLP